MEFDSSSSETHVMTIELVGNAAKVNPASQHVHPGDRVVFELGDFHGGYVFLFDAALFNRLHATLPDDELEVQPARPGVFPYFVVVRRRSEDGHRVEEYVADGNSMPYFVMD